MRRAKVCWGLVLAMMTCAATVAHADTLTATRAQPLTEVAHTVDVELRDGAAVYTVRRAFLNEGERHEEGVLRIELPPGAAAVGLRIKAGEVWHKGELMEAERALELYRELTGVGPHAPKDPALLRWIWASTLELRVFPILPGKVSTVEYTLVAPTEYTRGRHHVAYPMPSDDARLAETAIAVRAQASGGRVFLDDQAVEPGATTVLKRPEPRVRPAWWAEDAPIAFDSDAFEVADIAVDAAVDPASVRIDASISHTFRGDLTAHMVSPDGTWHLLHDRDGGGDNDLKLSQAKLSFADNAAPKTLAAGTWRLIVADHAGLDTGRIERATVTAMPSGNTSTSVWKAHNLPVFIPDADDGDAGFVQISAEPSSAQTTAARLAEVPVDGAHELMRLEIEAAPVLSAVPDQMATVFVIDASHTQGEDGIEAQLQGVRAYLKHAPHARVQLIAARRYATPLLPDFTPAKDVPPALDALLQRGALDPGNGSALDEGLRAASRLLASQRGARRVMAFSDDLLASRWSLPGTLASLRAPRRPLTHVVYYRGRGQNRVDITRDDAIRLAPLALKSGGVATQLQGLPTDDASALKRLDGLALGWVRPVRIDNVALTGLTKDQIEDGGELPEALEEGEGMRLMAMVDQAPSQVTFTGAIWAKPYRKRVRADWASGSRAAAYAFAHDLHDDLDRASMLRLAKRGKAVTPVTSYLAIEPGVRPSIIGLETMGRGLGMRGMGRAGYGRASGRRTPPDLAAELAAMIQACKAQHGSPTDGGFALWVETTHREIVDVRGPSNTSPLSTCVVEGTWEHRLSSLHVRSRADYTVSVR